MVFNFHLRSGCHVAAVNFEGKRAFHETIQEMYDCLNDCLFFGCWLAYICCISYGHMKVI